MAAKLTRLTHDIAIHNCT